MIVARTPDATLEAILSSRRWRRYALPFSHVRVDSVFKEPHYNKMAEAFQILLKKPGTFTRPYAWYDSLVAGLPLEEENSLRVFARADWWRMLGSCLSVETAGIDVSVELHHHLPESRSGHVHNDLNPGWFVGQQRGEECNLADQRRCAYKSGSCSDPSLKPRPMVRAVAMIFYLANSPWQAGDGGETAFYPAFTSSNDVSADAVPPRNNSMVAFRCSPYSFHRFLSNRRSPRSAIVGWLHEPYEAAATRWGEQLIVPWREERAC